MPRADANSVTCASCEHRFSFPECLAVWFPTRVPCPACRAVCTLGVAGWGAFFAVNLLGVMITLWALFECVLGTLAPNRAIAIVLLVAAAAPFVWVGALKLLPVRVRDRQSAQPPAAPSPR